MAAMARGIAHLRRSLRYSPKDGKAFLGTFTCSRVRESVRPTSRDLGGVARKDPLVEYKNEAFSMFSELMDNIKFEVLNNHFRSSTRPGRDASISLTPD